MTDFRRTRAHTQYHTADGATVPGVTTVLGVLAKHGLIHWAWKCGMEGQDYRAVRDTAGNVGTLAHQLIADELRGEVTTDLTTFTAEQQGFAAHCMAKWIEWKRDRRPTPILVETPMVSATGYGGTIDLYARVGRANELIDLKTGGAIYPEMLAQLAAYRQLLMEAGHKVRRARILRIGRNEGEGFEERIVTDFGPYWALFASALGAYRAQQEIKGGE